MNLFLLISKLQFIVCTVLLNSTKSFPSPVTFYFSCIIHFHNCWRLLYWSKVILNFIHGLSFLLFLTIILCLVEVFLQLSLIFLSMIFLFSFLLRKACMLSAWDEFWQTMESLTTAFAYTLKGEGKVESYHSFTFADSRSYLRAGGLPGGQYSPSYPFFNCLGILPQGTLYSETPSTA